MDSVFLLIVLLPLPHSISSVLSSIWCRNLIYKIGVFFFLPESLTKKETTSTNKLIDEYQVPIRLVSVFFNRSKDAGSKRIRMLLLLRFFYYLCFTLWETSFAFYNLQVLQLQARRSSYLLALFGIVFAGVQGLLMNFGLWINNQVRWWHENQMDKSKWRKEYRRRVCLVCVFAVGMVCFNYGNCHHCRNTSIGIFLRFTEHSYLKSHKPKCSKGNTMQYFFILTFFVVWNWWCARSFVFYWKFDSHYSTNIIRNSDRSCNLSTW